MFTFGSWGWSPYKPAASGPTTTPSWIASGTNSNATSNPTPAYPSNASGDLFVMDVYCNTGSVTSLTGWTQQQSVTDGVVTIYSFTRDTRATGSDSGTVTVTGTGNPIMAQIHCFRNVATSSFYEGNASATSGTSTLNMPSVTCSGNHRLACAVIGNNGNGGLAVGTGASGGTWTQRADSTSGLGAEHCLQTAAMDSGGTISGGTTTGGNTRMVCAAFALVGV